MSKKEDYSQQYNFHVSHLSLGQDKVSMLSQSHGPLTTRDIDGAQPRKFTSQRTPDRDCFKLHESEESSSEGRSIFRAPSHPRNPLDPEYDLPPAFIPPAEEMKFVRDTLDTSDIPGTRPREPRRYIERSRYTLNNEIQEEKSKLKRGCWEDQLRSNLDVTDINLKSNPNRETNRKIIVRATDALDTVGQQNSIQGQVH